MGILSAFFPRRQGHDALLHPSTLPTLLQYFSSSNASVHFEQCRPTSPGCCEFMTRSQGPQGRRGGPGGPGKWTLHTTINRLGFLSPCVHLHRGKTSNRQHGSAPDTTAGACSPRGTPPAWSFSQPPALKYTWPFLVGSKSKHLSSAQRQRQPVPAKQALSSCLPMLSKDRAKAQRGPERDHRAQRGTPTQCKGWRRQSHGLRAQE